MAERAQSFTATEIKAGALVLVSLFILCGFVVVVRGCRPSDETAKVFQATFSDTGGLNRGATVRFGGVEAGRVVDISPDSEDRSRIRVTVKVAPETPVNAGSVVSIGQTTFTAEKHFEISTGDASQPLLEGGALLPSRSGGGGLFDIPDFEGVISRLEAALDGVNVLLGTAPVSAPDGQAFSDGSSLPELMAAIEVTADEGAGAFREVKDLLRENRAEIRESLKHLVTLEQNATELMLQLNQVVAESREPLHDTFVGIQKLTEETSARIEEMAATLQTTLSYFEEVGGNSSDLLDGQRPAIEEILVNLQEATRNLKEFSRVLSQQPDALIRGKRSQGRKSGEE